MKLLDRARLAIAVAVAKIVPPVVKKLGLGAGSVLPGEIATRLHPQLLSLLGQQVRQGIILIVGTNGKTTTSLLLRTILEENGANVTHNASGANLINGLLTALLADTNFVGKLNADYAILEVDENVLPLILKQCQPKMILGLNLFRDQLDRYGEVDVISQRWQDAMSPLDPSTQIILNGDDPTLCYLGQHLNQTVLFFGLSEPERYLAEIPHAVDSIYCPACGSSLKYQGVYLSHLGDYDCPSCEFSKPQLDINSQQWGQILVGIYNKYNTLAAALSAQQLNIPGEVIKQTIKTFRAAFGRAEELTVEGKPVRILLSKNPVGMNETIRAVNESQAQGNSETTLLVLNDRTPDGTDVSWIWDVDTEAMVTQGGTIIVSGDRAYDMALRIHYSQPSLEEANFNLIVKENLKEAVTTALHHTSPHQTLHILPTYSAMLEVRQLLTGRKIQ